MAPGPVLGKFWPNGGYVALRRAGSRRTRARARRSATAMNKSLTYAQAHPDEIRALLPAATQNVRLPIWSPVVDRDKLASAREVREGVRRHRLAAEHDEARAEHVTGGKMLQGTVGNVFITLRLDGKAVTTLQHGKYTFVVTDKSKTTGFKLVGPRRDEEDEREGHRAEHVDADAEEGHVRLQLRSPIRSASARSRSPKASLVVDGVPGTVPGIGHNGRCAYGANVCVGAITTSSSTGSSRDASVGTISSSALDELVVRRDARGRDSRSARERCDVDVEAGHGGSPPRRSARRSMIA